MDGDPIAAGLFTWPDPDPALIGGECTECGRFTFPVRDGCPFCGAAAVRPKVLDREGTLWTWTSQGFLPKSPYSGQFADPDNFQPWYVGLIEIPGQLRIESLLVGCGQDDLAFGMPMRLTVVPFRTDSDGREVVTFAFTPTASPELAASYA